MLQEFVEETNRGEKRRNVMAALAEFRMNGAPMGKVNVKGPQSLLHGKRLEMRRFFSGCNP